MEWGGEAAPVWTVQNDRLGYCPQHLTATEDTGPTPAGARKFPPRHAMAVFSHNRFPRQNPT